MTALLVALVFFGTIFAIVGGFVFLNRRRLTSVEAARERLSDAPAVIRDAGGSPSTILRDQRVSNIGALNELLSGRGVTLQLSRELARAGSLQKPGEFLLLSTLAAFIGMTVVSFLFGALISIVGLPVGAMVPWMFLRRQQRRRERQFEQQLPDALDLLTNSLKAGYSLQAAMEFVGRESMAPLSTEFLRFYDEQRLGVDVRTALLALQERVGTDDVRMFVTSLLLQRETGGNLSELLNTISTLIRQRLQLRGQLQTLTAEPKMSAQLLSAMPFVMFAVVYALNPTYMRPMLVTSAGHTMLALSVVMVVVGYAIMSRIADVEM
ncbi:MAG: type II secretion system F family protein [Gemmatimonadota bacterium]|nr:type II secretion system F family protein [Gemmatimonadota bacterium]